MCLNAFVYSRHQTPPGRPSTAFAPRFLSPSKVPPSTPQYTVQHTAPNLSINHARLRAAPRAVVEPSFGESLFDFYEYPAHCHAGCQCIRGDDQQPGVHLLCFGAFGGDGSLGFELDRCYEYAAGDVFF